MYFPPYIDASGIYLPTYEDRLQDLVSAYHSIFGQEAELDPAVPDYQLLSVFAKALDDTSALVLAAYNSRNPAYASGQALDLLLPQYGMMREPGETDAKARARMNLAMASRGIFTFEAMEAAIRAVPNVTHVMIRVNEEDTTVDGVPGHTIAAYVNNGNAGQIAEAIWNSSVCKAEISRKTVKTDALPEEMKNEEETVQEPEEPEEENPAADETVITLLKVKDKSGKAELTFLSNRFFSIRYEDGTSEKGKFFRKNGNIVLVREADPEKTELEIKWNEEAKVYELAFIPTDDPETNVDFELTEGDVQKLLPYIS